jgi:lysozyme
MNLGRLEIQVMADEGFRAVAYQDSLGYWTIGYGTRHILGQEVTEATPRIRSDVARSILRSDLYKAILDVEELFPNLRSFNHYRQEVLANMAYNLGFRGLRNFKRMRAALDLSYFTDAADEMIDSLWYRQVGSRAHRLEQIMRTGALTP